MQFKCKNCNQTLDADESLAGTYIACPTCKARQRVPGASTAADSQSAGDAKPLAQRISWVPALVFQSIALGVLLILAILAAKFESYYTHDEKVTLEVFYCIWGITQSLMIIFSSMLHYKCWAALPEQFARVTPGKAVGMMFVPGYNFYWAFQSILGLTQDYDNWARRNDVAGVRRCSAMGLALFVLFDIEVLSGLIMLICILFFDEFGMTIPFLVQTAFFVVWLLFYLVVVGNANVALAWKEKTASPQK